MGQDTIKKNIDGMVDILDYTEDFNNLSELSDVISVFGDCYYCHCPEDRHSGNTILKGYLSLGYDDKEMHLEGIFQSGSKVIKLSIIEILYFIYKDKDVAETFIKAYGESLNE